MALKKLGRAIRKYEKEILEALKTDLGKSNMEAFMCEVGLSLSEISYMLCHIGCFAATKYVPTPITNFPSVSKVMQCPYGNVLIMSPWNYPFLLSIEPAIDAIAAGNTVIIKPSAYSPATSEIIAKIIGETFPEEYVAVITGGRKENAFLLTQKFDYIFFTGSQEVGREGPCIVMDDADFKVAAKRLAWGKFLNCGQTCVAPDYILCDEYIKDELVKQMKREIIRQFGRNPLKNKNYGKIINEKHFNRLKGLMDEDKVIFGGECNEETLQIAPALMDNVTWNDAVMGQEIFGPVLPILTFNDIDEVVSTVEDHKHPLALYIFSKDKDNIRKITERCRYGGGCINDAVVHLATSEMPFGGVGDSGMGAYHGRKGFETFTHEKSILDKKTWLDLPMRYQPYLKINEKLLKLFLR
ncbi:MAG: Aldehyde dehydrogenase [Firmicutes bacterium ADurb.Bin354]|nr:MAG: Aldehyde dehydrogenase [Firmicutes bacterium ADurb.Bin354]